MHDSESRSLQDDRGINVRALEMYGAEYYAKRLGPIPYNRGERHWLDFFGGIADEIVRSLRPSSVLDVGCAIGLLVEALWRRGVKAYGIDISEYAISQVPRNLQGFCRVASVTEPLPTHFPGRFDLITCIEVLEHIPEDGASGAIKNMASRTECILFSSTPEDIEEPTHLNVRPVIYWLQLFADLGFYPDMRFDMGFVSPQAYLLRKVKPRLQRDILPFFATSVDLRLRHLAERRDQDRKLAERRAQVEGLEAAMAVRDSRINELEGERGHLEAALAEHRAQVEELEAAVAVRDGRINELEGEHRRLEEALAERRAQVEGLEAAVAVRDGRISELEGEHRRLEEALAERQARAVAARDARISQLEGLHAQSQDDLNRTIHELKRQVETSRLEVEQLNSRLEVGQEAYRQSQEYIAGLKRYLANIEGSYAWHLVTRLRTYRDRLFPADARYRTVLDRLIRKAKLRIQEASSSTTKNISDKGTELDAIPSINGSHTRFNARPKEYAQWIRENEPDDQELERQRAIALKLQYRPRISIIVPTWDPKSDVILDTLRSVLDQTYDNWELCIAGGGESDPGFVRKLADLPNKDTRIRVKLLERNLGISGNSNEALALAQGEFVALLDHDDIFAPSALFEVVKTLNGDPGLDFVYSDKDLLTADGRTRFDPLFKPNLSMEILLSANYLTHLCVIRRTFIEQVGRFRPETDGAQDWDLFLRILEKTDRVAHIPRVLYHWRAVPTSASTGLHTKPYAANAQLRVVTDHLRRQGIQATASFTASGFLRVHWPVSGCARVSIIIPVRDRVDLLRQCLNTLLERTSYRNFELLVIDTGSDQPETFQYYDEIEKHEQIRVLHYSKPFNYSAVNNFGASRASGDILVFLNNDTEIVHSDWLEELVRWVELEQVGAVGAKLLKPDGTIQHAGVILGLTGFAGHVFAGLTEGYWGPYGSPEWYRNYLAVTGACLAVRRELFEEVGGFNEEFLYCGSDVEFCLRLWERGYRVVYTPFAKLIHRESATRGEIIPQSDFVVSLRYYEPYLRKGDPFFNAGLSHWHLAPRLRIGDEQSPVDFAEKIVESQITRPAAASNEQRAAKHEPAIWTHYSRDAEVLVQAHDFTEQDLASSPACDSHGNGPEVIHTINWFMPDFSYAGYGGVRTILRFAAYFSSMKDVQNRFLIEAPNSLDKTASAIRDSFPELADSPVTGLASLGDLARVPGADACVSTLWTTAYWLLRFDRTRKKFYFIQDWESMFYPAGSTSMQAEATYRFGFYGIANTRTLKTLYESKYGAKAEYFDPCVELELFHPNETKRGDDPVKVFFYGRPEHPRNGFELGITALRKVKERFGDAVEIVAAGASWNPIDYQLDGIAKNLGLLPYEETAKLYRSCDIGLLLMATYHPSYIPLESMASGCVVVSNFNPATTWLMKDGMNCILSRPSASCLAEAIGRAILDPGLRQRLRTNALELVREAYSDWSAQIEKIFNFMCRV